MIIIPQITVSTEDAKVNTLKTNLGGMRSAIELYYHQHKSFYPGMKQIDGSELDVAGAVEGAAAFVAQLVTYSEETGEADPDSAALTNPIGPYMKGGQLPKNPFDNDNDIMVDIATTDITTRVADGTTSWKFYCQTGVLIANDDTETDGVNHETY